MDKAQLLQGKDAISSKMAKCFFTIKEERFQGIHCTSFEAKFEKNKTEVPRLGAAGTAHKAAGWKGTFSLSGHFVSSRFQLLLEEYKNTGVDIYFDTQVTINDPTSDAGEYTVIFKNCNLDSGLLMKFDAEGELLMEDVEGTYDDFEIVTAFNDLPGMN